MGAAANGMAASGLVPCVGTFFVFSDYMRPTAAARGDHADEGLLRLDARLGRRRRGRPDAPADRAARVAACDARAARHPPRRRQRGRGRVEGAPRRRRARPRCCSPARRSRSSTARPNARPPACPRARTCSRPRTAIAPDVVLIGTGSEVQVCVAARELLAAQGIAARVVSMPSWSLFEQQPDEYRIDVLPPGVPDARRRGRRAFRLGALRRRRREHRSLRRVGARRRRDARARDHTGDTLSSAHSRCSMPSERKEAEHGERHPSLGRVRAEPVVRQPHPRARDRRSAEADRRARHPRRHVEPDDLREGDGRGRRLRRAAARGRRARARRPRPRTGISSPPTSRTRPTCCARSTTGSTAADGYVSIEVSPDLAHDTAGTIARRRNCGNGSPAPT